MKEISIEIYKFILMEINGWTKEDVSKLEFEEFEADPIFEGIMCILSKGGVENG